MKFTSTAFIALAGASLASGFLVPNMPHPVTSRTRGVMQMAASQAEYESCWEEVKTMVDNANCAPIMVRLAWHDSGTFDESKKGDAFPVKGGANGSIRFSPEIEHGANAGLTLALKLLTPIKNKFENVGWADLMQMASAAAIEVTGGPKIDMKYGRKDATGPEDCPKEGNLPGANVAGTQKEPFPDGTPTPADHLRKVFNRMGFNDQEIVALSGAHTLGRAFKDRSGLGKEENKFTNDKEHVARGDGKKGYGRNGGQPWTEKFLKFDNSYFTSVYDENADPELLKLDTDTCLFGDEGFRPTAIKYAEDQDTFFNDYAAVHKKLSELGSEWEAEVTVSSKPLEKTA